MKQIIFLFLALPLFATGQNYLFEITPQNGEFRVLVTDDTREAYPRDITDFGTLDTANLQLLAYQRIEAARSRQASLAISALIADLNAEQTAAAIGAFIPLNYSAWINGNLAGVYNGAYQYTERKTTATPASKTHKTLPGSSAFFHPTTSSCEIGMVKTGICIRRMENASPT